MRCRIRFTLAADSMNLLSDCAQGLNWAHIVCKVATNFAKAPNSVVNAEKVVNPCPAESGYMPTLIRSVGVVPTGQRLCKPFDFRPDPKIF